MELNKELLSKAKEAKTPEELLTLAKENGTELTEAEAKTYFDLLHPQTGELSDDELDNVSQWVIDGMLECCKTCRVTAYCHSCQYCTYEKGLWLCNNPVNMK